MLLLGECGSSASVLLMEGMTLPFLSHTQSRSRQEDPEQLRLKQKAKEVSFPATDSSVPVQQERE